MKEKRKTAVIFLIAFAVILIVSLLVFAVEVSSDRKQMGIQLEQKEKEVEELEGQVKDMQEEMERMEDERSILFDQIWNLNQELSKQNPQ